jgi:hypothetical protein
MYNEWFLTGCALGTLMYMFAFIIEVALTPKN